MSIRKLIAVFIFPGVLGIFSVSTAQEETYSSIPGTSSASESKTLGDRFDDIHRMIFGSPASGNKNSRDKKEDKEKVQNNKKSPRPMPGKYIPYQESGNTADSQDGGIIKPSEVNQKQTTGNSQARSVRVYRTDGNNSSAAQVSENRSGRRYFEEKVQDGADTPENTQFPSGASGKRSAVVIPNKNSDASGERFYQAAPIIQPLHERFSQFRRSVFDGTSGESSLPVASSSAKGDIFKQKSSHPSVINPYSDAGESVRPTIDKAENMAETRSGGRPTLAKRPIVGASSDSSAVAERTLPKIDFDGARVAENPFAEKPDTVKDADKSFAAGTLATSEDGVLFARKSPIISVETHGARKISVGKDSAYEIKILNSGDVAAEDLIVFVNLPEWAEVIGTETSVGSTQAPPAVQMSAPFLWKVGRLEAKSQEKMALRIVPRESRPFDLAVRWEFKPAASQTMIEVQEPKLEMKMDGPREVCYGKKETYRLKLSNTGNGNAEGVTIKFLPVGSGDNLPAIYELGLLPAGEDKSIEVELTARQSGTLEIQVEAKGAAGLHAELAEKVLVRRAGLYIGVEGPKLQFVGAAAVYTVRVKNTGNAPSKNIDFIAALPAGLKYLGGLEDARVEGGNKLHWSLETLNPESVQTFTLKCTPSTAGISRLEVAASAEDDLSASAIAVTQVESVANLALDVKDPGVPVPVSEEAVYEIRVRNRGTKDAEGVEVIGYFSRGIEPISAEGGANRIAQGQVVFTPIRTIAPGTEVTLKIRARAEAPGNHVFRAEMYCKELGSRLVSEESTLYYQDALAIPQNLQARPLLDHVVR
jgi:uncharacterized repeat protein (TIGR01451 family)